MSRALVALAILALSGPLHAQSVRVTGHTTARYVSARALREDSVNVADVTGTGVLRYMTDGTPVRCLTDAGPCRYLKPGDVLHTVPLMQDLSVAAWGFGQGVRLQAQLRLRPGALGDDDLWPQADDRFEAMEAYLEVARSIGRVRIGRQWQASGIGSYSYDGASVQLRRASFLFDGYVGWSLLRGLSEPVNGDGLAALEPFAPEERGVLFGSRVQWRNAGGSGASVAYQREIRSDRKGLYSERLSAGAFHRRARGSIEAELDADVGTRVLNDLRVTARTRPLATVGLHAFGRYYRPYFDLWTIWGAFTPVGFEEFGAGATLDRNPVSVTLDIARRSYGDTDAVLTFAPQRDDGWRVSGSAAARLRGEWSASARYAADVGFGAARNEVALGLRRAFAERAHLGIEGTVFDRASDYQLSDGVVVGAALDGALRLHARSRVSGHLMQYRHLGADERSADWSQLRALLQLEWTIGAEPGGAR